ncbi:anti-sigma factor [Streptomyces sp. NBC_00670]|uniref:anti-sigma factor n=1 Tax=Streptomyces sp. NBC_00670 TaxID=2975804 RepID=UPI002E33D10B|nr:anti-sigma factor [Streptomyces sp. NBC_00670]
MTADTADLHTLTGAYALHALDERERDAFARHLSLCAPCAAEVRELTATAARLGGAAATPPRPQLKEEVLRRITTVRQEPPHTTPAARPAGTGGARTRRLFRWALAACLAAAAALGGTAVWQHQQADDAQEQARRAEHRVDEIAAVLAAPDARTRTADLKGATGTVVVSKSENRAVFVVAGMDRPPEGKVYQLWFDDGGSMRPAGLMDPDRSTEAVLLKGALDGASGMGVTLEPAGGSPRPTSTPLALVPFSA